MSIELLNMDCMAYMRDLPDNAFDLAIVDPPYGISAPKMNMGSGYCNGRTYQGGKKNRLSQGAGKLKDRALQKFSSEWDACPPGPEYFAELMRVSKNQIIWGGNYFDLPPTRCVICWDKEQPWENFSQWEMAWSSFDKPAALFKRQNGIREPGKIHPTQKPVKLYEWLLHRFAEPGMTVLDTHLGSASSAIAAHYFGVGHFVGTEIDDRHFSDGRARYERETAQVDMFAGGVA